MKVVIRKYEVNEYDECSPECPVNIGVMIGSTACEDCNFRFKDDVDKKEIVCTYIYEKNNK